MTTGKVFGNSNIANRPEFGGIDPRIEVQQQEQAQSLAEEQQRLTQESLRLTQESAAQAQKSVELLQEAIAKFLAKEITKAEFESISESLK